MTGPVFVSVCVERQSEFWMRIKRKVLALLALFVLLAFTGLAGCKNVCQKAIDKMEDCMREYCDDHSEDDDCQNVDELIEEGRKEAEERMGDECPDEAKEALERLMDQDCEQFIEALM